MRWWLVLLLVAAVAAKGKKHKHQKPGRAVLDRLASTTVSEPEPGGGGAGAGARHPAPLDVAPYSRVEASATCGADGVEEYCREMPGKRGVVCDSCEGAGGAPSRRHPARHAVDGDPGTWWQSPTLAAGDQYRDVSLTVTLPDTMELYHVIIKSGPSPRPLAWSLEISPSETNDDWELIRAFGDKEHCRKLWDLRPERRRRKVRRAAGGKRMNRADKPTCSTQFTSPRPLENGEMHYGLGGVLARRVRISLRAPHPAPPDRQYYTVRSLTVAASCSCGGHADRCVVGSDGAKCICEDNTCGDHCALCCGGGPSSPDAACDVSRPGDVVDADCQCGERGQCAYDDTGAILCVNCTENRAGPLCDRCLASYYSVASDGPCLPCDCDPEGSDGTCKYNKKQRSVQCACVAGASGARCDVTACACDERGVVDPAAPCDQGCRCKPNVVGLRCDACATGYFGLAEGQGEGGGGCRECYCAGAADRCEPDPQPGVHMALPLGEERWLVAALAGNQTLSPDVDDQGKPYLISYEVEGWDSYYWTTTSFSGSQLSAYGGSLVTTVSWSIVRGDTGGSPTMLPDYVIVAEDGTRLCSTFTQYETTGETTLQSPLVEGHWRFLDPAPAAPGVDPAPGVTGVNPTPGVRATRVELMDVLARVKMLMVRAHFHWDQDEVRLNTAAVTPSPAYSREICACRPGYSGAHCTDCAWGYARVANVCLPCACSGHAACETVDGECGPCQHNTTGPHCERCLPGHYGNPLKGGCKPCACPLYEASNNFSPLCALASPDDDDDFVCTQCPDGYAGDRCEMCDAGYWGSPLTPGSSCQLCACGGAACHPGTGACVQCGPHARGAACDQCQEGYYNDSSSLTCVPCACGPGSLHALCDERGACACAQGWAGRACDVCAEGYGDITSNCPPCACGVAALTPTCDVTTGRCACAAGALPPRCDECAPGFYQLTADGCSGCNCSSLGSESNVCDIRSGQCRCKPHVTGRACDTCEEGYWGLTAGGCRRCECGAGAAACDPVTGACACARGVTGAHCNTCLSGFYGFGPAGCLPCPTCTEGKVCSRDSGRCVCPSATRGPRCGACARGHWGRAPNCSRCECGPGATGPNCDPITGQCQCRLGWAGRRCERCAGGHYGPRCRPCACDPAGAVSSQCDDDGRCVCKENVIGDKCSRCKEGTFGLSPTTPGGCTACFCFGRSAHCTQAGLTRAAVHAARHTHVTVVPGPSYKHLEQESLLAIHSSSPEVTIALPRPPVPVYVELDKRFLGDRVTSYGGLLRFTVEEEGGEELPAELLARFPLVRLAGPPPLALDYYQRTPSRNGTHSVRLHESLWQVTSPAPPAPHGAPAPRAAARAALMVALQQVTRLLLRVTTRQPVTDYVHALLLNVSLDTAIDGVSRSAPAEGVELCECPEQYAASSCHHPAVGFWMPPQSVHYKSVAGTIVIELEGDARACECGGRASECDPRTGDCLNCTANTAGPRCDICAPGHHGSPAAGCLPCPCPHDTRNHAAACAVEPTLQCLCLPGYTGEKCDACTPDYKPTLTGDCEPCDCDPYGSLSQHCDESGKCLCQDFATGDKCDKCRDRSAFMDNGGCSPCDNCSQTLLHTISHINSELKSKADPTELRRLPKPYPALLQFSSNCSHLYNQLPLLREYREGSRRLGEELEEVWGRGEEVKGRVEAQRELALINDKAANYLSLESMTGLEDVLTLRRRIAEQVSLLDDFAQGERHVSAHRALRHAAHLLAVIKGVSLETRAAAARDVLDKATSQSTSIQEHDYQISSTLSRLQALQSALSVWSAKLDDVSRLAERVWDAGDTVTAVGQRVRPKLVEIRDLGLRCRLVLEDISTASTHNLTSQLISSLHQSDTLSRDFPAATAELTALAAAAEEKEGILYNLTPVYRDKYLMAVEKHVAELGEKAKVYKSLFAGTRSFASAGLGAARAWADVGAALAAAAAAATSALTHATLATKLARGPKPLVSAAEEARQASRRLVGKGEETLKSAEELSTKLQQLTRSLSLVPVTLGGAGWAERRLAPRPAPPPAATAAAAAAAARQAAASRALYDHASEIRRQTRYNLRRQLTELQKHGDSQLGAAQEHVSQIRGNTLLAAEAAGALAAAAAARASEHRAADVRVRPSVTQLKDMIARAKHAADAIQVSLTSKPGSVGCSRAYRLPSYSASLTRISLAVSFDNAVRDGTLLSLTPEEDSSYMKLYVEDARFKLKWSLGEDEGFLEHKEALEATHDDADHTSYRIEINRVWNVVTLSLSRSGHPPSSITNSTRGGVTLGRARAWLGAPGAPLPACAHALYYDDRRVGLWNFMEQPAEAQCMGCTQRWYSAARDGEPNLVWFSGEGYAELRRSSFRPADARAFSLSLVFRTRDENALLFMAVDAANNRSVSLFLRNCHVVFLVEYGVSTLQIAARGRHCHGRAVHVQAIRVFATNKLEKGSLRVNGEETLGSPDPPVQSPSSLPDLSSSVYWVGGAAPGAPAAPPPLLGCLGALTVDREGYDLMDTPNRHGLEPNCGPRTLRSATATGAGYIELPAPAFRRKAALGLSFRARAPAGLLLYRPHSGLIAQNDVDDEDDGDDKHYLVIALVDGELVVVISAGKSELRLRANGTRLDDGRLHTLRLVRAHKQVELWIDTTRALTGTLSGNALAARARGLYLSGLPPGLRPRLQGGGEGVAWGGFTGTVADFIVDGNLIGLDTAVNWAGVRLGRADSEPESEPRTEPRALQAQPAKPALCTKTESYTVEPGAVRFGDAPHSHLVLRLPARRELAVALQLRTFRHTALLLLAPGSKSKPRHYIALVLRDGKLRLLVRGRKRRDLTLSQDVADGTWRSVSVRISPSRLVLASGGAAVTARAPRRLAHAPRLYVGNAPPPPTTVPDSVVRIGGLRGCVRKVIINGIAQDLARAAPSPRHVGQCFPAVEPAAHLAGDAYAVWSSSWSSGAGELRLQFRSAGGGGVLLASSRLLLELRGGTLILTRLSPTGSIQSRVQSPTPLCDGQWHSVAARLAPAALAVDGGPEVRDSGGLTPLVETVTPPEKLYIGGLPEGVLDGVGSRENFRGCIRDVSVGGEQRDWTDMESIHNVLLDSCPVAQ